MFDYLLGVSQNLVAEIAILVFSVLAWRRLRRRWASVEADGRKVLFSVLRAGTGVVAVGCFAAAAIYTSFEHALGAAATAALFLFAQLMGVGFLASAVRLAHPATSWRTSVIVGYGVSAAAGLIGWLADVRIATGSQMPRDAVMASALVLAGGFVLVAPVAAPWLARRLDNEDEAVMPARALTGFALACTVLGGAFARHHFTWPQALWYGPPIGAASLIATTTLFQVLVTAARSLTSLADEKGWLPPSPKAPDLSLPPDAPVMPPELSPDAPVVPPELSR